MKTSATQAAILFLFVPLGAPEPSVGAQSPRALPERFLREAPEAWKAYQRFAGRLQGTISFKSWLMPEKKQIEGISWTVKQGDDAALFEEQLFPGQGGYGSVAATNRGYGFSLSRRESSAPWVISSVTKPDDEGAARRSIRRLVTAAQNLETVVDRLDFVAIMKEPGFAITRAEAIVSDGRQLVKIHFTYRYTGREGLKRTLRGGTITFDPEAHWTMREYECAIEYDNGIKHKRTGVFHFKDPNVAFPILRRIDHVVTAEKWKQVSEYEFDLEEGAPEEGAFRLSAYGFPEPGGQTQPRRTWYLWLAGAAVICLIVIFLVRRRQAKRQPA